MYSKITIYTIQHTQIVKTYSNCSEKSRNIWKEIDEKGGNAAEIEIETEFDPFFECELLGETIEVDVEPQPKKIDEAAVRKKLGQLQVQLKSTEKMEGEEALCENIRGRIAEAKSLLVQATPPEKRKKDLEKQINEHKHQIKI